jgi:hypothetical protein
MSEAAVDESPMLLDGDLPRLGAAPVLPQAPSPVPTPPTPADAPTGLSPAPAGPAVNLPGLPAPTLPTPEKQSLVDLAATVGAEEADKVVDRGHPMAHLMPEKMKPSEASLRAAEQRAAKKKKARRIKIGATVLFLAVAAVVGPPLGRWLIDAINEAGSTKTDEPAVESDQPAVEDPAATPQAGLDAIDDLEQLVGGSTAPAAP